MIVRTILRPETAFRFYLDDMLDRFQYYKDHGAFPENDDEGEEKRLELYEMLTEEQRITVWGLSADLYSLLDKEQPPVSDVTLTREEIAGQLETAYSASNWSELLRMLRYQNNLMPRAVVDYMRYRDWSELGYQEVALAFIRNAVRFDPEIE